MSNHIDDIKNFGKSPLEEDKDRINRVWEVLDEIIVGEDYTKKALFLCLASALLKERGKTAPLGVYITGESSGGKSHLSYSLLKLFPDDMKIIFGGASAKALRYLEDKDYVTYEGDESYKDDKGEFTKFKKVINFDRKILMFLEDTGGEAAFSDIRPILSRDQKEIRFTVTVKGKTKGGSEKFQNQDVYIRGCPTFITTSTKSQILAETGTRVLQLSPDETKEQSKKIVENKAMNEAKFINEPDYTPYQEWISSLKKYHVWVPFADLLSFPLDNLNIRRDFDKVINLIKTYTLLNQKNRKLFQINGHQVLVSTLEDMFAVLDIVLPILKPTLMNLPKKVMTFYEVMCELKKSNPMFRLSHKELAIHTGISQNSVRNYCWNLVEGGYLLVERDGQENVYQIQNNTKRVTSVTLSQVTASMLARSFESAKFTILQGVTNKDDGLYTIEANNLLNYIYTLSVTLQKNLNFDITEFETWKNGVTSELVTQGNNSSCISCGINSPPAALNKEGLCDLCVGK